MAGDRGAKRGETEMSDEATIIQAAKDHFEAMSGRPTTVWANQKAIGDLPRVEFSEGPIAAPLIGLDGASNASFLFQVTVVTASGTYSAESDQLAQAIITHFAAGTRVSTAKVDARPARGTPFPDGDEWRLPITIRMRSILTNS
jgi:hypothetical protein